MNYKEIPNLIYNTLFKIINNSLSKNTFFKEFSYYGTSTFLYNLSRILVELAAAKILGPKLWGIWYLLNLVISYRGVIQFGITNGMNREIPHYIGVGDKNKVQKTQNVTYTSLLIYSILGILILFLFSVVLNDDTLKTSIIWMIPLYLANQLYFFIETSLRANSLFNLISKKQIMFAIIFPILSIPLTYYYGLTGFILGFSISLLLPALYFFFKGPLRFNIELDISLTKDLIKIGLPIMLLGMAYTFMNTVDRWIIIYYYDATQLGIYSLAILVFGGMRLLPMVVSQQLYPRMAKDWGKNNSKFNLIIWAKKQTKYTSYLTIIIFIPTVFFFPWLIKNYLVEYESGIIALLIIIFGTLFIPLSAGWNSVLIIINKQMISLYIVLASIIVNLTLNLIFVHFGMGVNGVALATTISFMIYNISILIVGKYLLKKDI